MSIDKRKKEKTNLKEIIDICQYCPELHKASKVCKKLKKVYELVQICDMRENLTYKNTELLHRYHPQIFKAVVANGTPQDMNKVNIKSFNQTQTFNNQYLIEVVKNWYNQLSKLYGEVDTKLMEFNIKPTLINIVYKPNDKITQIVKEYRQQFNERLRVFNELMHNREILVDSVNVQPTETIPIVTATFYDDNLIKQTGDITRFFEKDEYFSQMIDRFKEIKYQYEKLHPPKILGEENGKKE